MADRRIKTGERDAIQELSKREMEDVQGGIIATANGSIASAEGLATLAHPNHPQFRLLCKLCQNIGPAGRPTGAHHGESRFRERGPKGLGLDPPW